MKSIRIATWNVNGIRSVAEKGFLGWLDRHQPDFVCLQEVKAKPEQLEPSLLSPFGYQSHWFPAQKPGYSGVAIYSRLPVLDIQYGLKSAGSRVDLNLIQKFDEEGRVLCATFQASDPQNPGRPQNTTLVNAYFPNSQRDHARLGFKIEFCQQMLLFLQGLRDEGQRVILCGDYNIAHKPIDLRNPKANEANAGYLPEERAWMDCLVSAGFIDAFRLFEPGGGNYTWWSYRPGVREKNIGWRLDYHFVSPDLASSVKSCSIENSQGGSDHCPVWIELEN